MIWFLGGQDCKLCVNKLFTVILIQLIKVHLL